MDEESCGFIDMQHELLKNEDENEDKNEVIEN